MGHDFRYIFRPYRHTTISPIAHQPRLQKTERPSPVLSSCAHSRIVCNLPSESPPRYSQDSQNETGDRWERCACFFWMCEQLKRYVIAHSCPTRWHSVFFCSSVPQKSTLHCLAKTIFSKRTHCDNVGLHFAKSQK